METNVFAPPRTSSLSRRNTIGVAGSPFNYRRPRVLQSTPLANRNLNDSSFLANNVNNGMQGRLPQMLDISDCSTIYPVVERGENNVQTERESRPSIFGRENAENFAMKRDVFANRDNFAAMNNRFDPPKNAAFKRPTPPTAAFLETKADDFEEVQPALLFSSTTRKNAPQTAEKSESKPMSGGRKGPPLSSIRSYEPAIKRAKTVTHQDLPQRKESDIPEEDYWVTVFGFEKEQLQEVLDLFNRHGSVIKHKMPEEGNWVNIRYGSVTHAEQAIARNGQLLDKIMIGVIPTTKPHGSDSLKIIPKLPGHNEKLAESFGVQATNSLSDPVRIDKGFYPGMRACAAPGFRFNEPKADESIMSRILNVFK